MIDAPVAVAFAAGMVSTMNPCGFAMLPAYLSYFLTSRAEGPPVVRALRVGTTVSGGFLVVFGLTGGVIAGGGQALIAAIPWAALVVGGILVVLGIGTLAGKKLPLPTLAGAGGRRPGLFAFGVSYAVASLSCTLPVFLAVVGTTLTTDLVSALAAFGAYGLGMALVLLAITVALALGNDWVVRRLRAVGRHLERIGGVVLVVAGAYIVWFWTLNLSRPVVEATGPIAAVEQLSSVLTRLVGDNPLVSGAAAALIVGAAVLYVLVGRGRRGEDAERPSLSR